MPKPFTNSSPAVLFMKHTISSINIHVTIKQEICLFLIEWLINGEELKRKSLYSYLCALWILADKASLVQLWPRDSLSEKVFCGTGNIDRGLCPVVSNERILCEKSASNQFNRGIEEVPILLVHWIKLWTNYTPILKYGCRNWSFLKSISC